MSVLLPSPTTRSKKPARPAVAPVPGKTAEGSNRRQELIEVAARCFREKGFDATTTRDIAAASGMQSGSPFYHFKSKNELLFAVMQTGMERALRTQEHTLSTLPRDTNARDRLHALVHHHLQVLLMSPGNDFIAVMVTEQRALLPEHRHGIREQRDRYEQVWREVLAELEQQELLHAPASITRLALFGSLHGTLNWYDSAQKLSLAALATHLMAIFVRPSVLDSA